uniref:Uncharacterized protein n=1 Tax=Picea sitchensis TaxID=3332 RepID=D5ACB5_PICSI|nr:unknown [Picea sitchensis]
MREERLRLNRADLGLYINKQKAEHLKPWSRRKAMCAEERRDVCRNEGRQECQITR